MRHKLVTSRHINAVNILIAQGRCGTGHVHLSRTSLPSHLDNLGNRRASDDGIVNQQHVFVFELKINGIQLLPHGFPTLFLSRHDERSADVAVLNKTFAILGAQLMGQWQCRRSSCIREWVSLHQCRGPAENIDSIFFCQMFTHSKTAFVDRYIVDNGVRSGKVHVLEDTGHQARVSGALMTKNFSLV